MAASLYPHSSPGRWDSLVISIPPRGLGRPERGVTFPRSHRVDTEDHSSGCLHPNPACPPLPTVLFPPSQSQPGGGARLRSRRRPAVPLQARSRPQPGFAEELTGALETQLESLGICRAEALPPRASHQCFQRRTPPSRNHPGGEPRLGFLILANFLLILIGGFARDRNTVPGQWHFREDHTNRVPRRKGRTALGSKRKLESRRLICLPEVFV